MKTYWYTMYRAAPGKVLRGQARRQEINPQPQEMRAEDMSHALQKIAASIDEGCISIAIWEGN